jgi:small subunit ribosomal protein S16
MVKLRLQRYGKNKAPFYRVVAADSHSPRDGRFIEIIGTYHPTSKVEAEQLKINEELALKWLKNGAQPTDTVKSIFTKLGINQKFEELK